MYREKNLSETWRKVLYVCDNPVNLFFAVKIYYEVLDDWVTRQNKKYFKDAKNGKEWRELRAGKRQNQQ